jgi:hypothetical protein
MWSGLPVCSTGRSIHPLLTYSQLHKVCDLKWNEIKYNRYCGGTTITSERHKYKVMWQSEVRAPCLRVLPWHLPYNWGKSTENLSHCKINLSRIKENLSHRVLSILLLYFPNGLNRCFYKWRYNHIIFSYIQAIWTTNFAPHRLTVHYTKHSTAGEMGYLHNFNIHKSAG